jgi:hypothetical protein
MGIPIGGTCFVFVNGDQWPLRGNMTIGPSRVERTGVAGQDTVHGFTEMPVVPYMEGDFSTEPNMQWQIIDGYTDVTVQANLINGFSYVLRNAWVARRVEINTREGQTRIRFEGMDCVEIPGQATPQGVSGAGVLQGV